MADEECKRLECVKAREKLQAALDVVEPMVKTIVTETSWRFALSSRITAEVQFKGGFPTASQARAFAKAFAAMAEAYEDSGSEQTVDGGTHAIS